MGGLYHPEKEGGGGGGLGDTDETETFPLNGLKKAKETSNKIKVQSRKTLTG